MRVLTLNAGSGTLKVSWAEVAGSVARVRARVTRSSREESTGPLLDECLGALAGAPERVDAVAHRLVHGADRFVDPVRLDEAVEKEIRGLIPLAPLHLPPALAGIAAARVRFPGVPHVAVFDTAFHAERAPESQIYALPPGACPEVRRYGFHGIAHRSLAEALAGALGARASEVNAVTLQLGSGCSACAVERGRSAETSMGFTPLEGLVMATRAGDVDPGVLLHLLRSGYDADGLEDLLARRSGLLALAGSADVREVLAAEQRGDPRATLALRLFVRRIAMVVGSYWTLLGGHGALVFGGGIGSGSPEIRARIAASLTAWNIGLDAERNQSGERGLISAEGSRPVYVFDTDEERILASEADRCLSEAVGR